MVLPRNVKTKATNRHKKTNRALSPSPRKPKNVLLTTNSIFFSRKTLIFWRRAKSNLNVAEAAIFIFAGFDKTNQELWLVRKSDFLLLLHFNWKKTNSDQNEKDTNTESRNWWQQASSKYLLDIKRKIFYEVCAL